MTTINTNGEPMKKYIWLILVLGSGEGVAGVTCLESVTSVILHKNRNIYFTTSDTCHSWCQIKWSDESDKNRAFSALIAAKTSSNKLSFRWPGIDTCEAKNTTYESPDYFGY